MVTMTLKWIVKRLKNKIPIVGTDPFSNICSMKTVIFLIALCLSTFISAAQTLTTLVNFNETYETSGAFPGNLIQASDGDFYGTTSSYGANNDGTIFRMTPDGTLTVLVAFDGTNGEFGATLIQTSDGNFYGTTTSGGNNLSLNGGYGYGTVFKMTLDGLLTTLVNFNGTNGEFGTTLLQTSDGNFYGTTELGGTNYYGTIFRMTQDGLLTTLVNFNGTNGENPAGALIQASDGNFYGMAQGGATNYYGTIFRMTQDGLLTNLVNFTEPMASFLPVL
jgi:uncharacterized repeat protein (TIGR03803 family)